MEVQICPWCDVNAGRTHGERRCCQLRELALAPKHVKAEYARGLSEPERAALRLRLQDEMNRLKALQNVATQTTKPTTREPA